MRGFDLRDVVGGLLVAGAGLFVGLHAASSYPMGTVRMMGPGLFPTVLGGLLTLLGLLILVPALFRRGSLPNPHLRETSAVFGGLVVFALVAAPLGIVPAIVGLTLVAALASPDPRPVRTLLLAGALALLAVLIFRIGLGVPLRPFRWPF